MQKRHFEAIARMFAERAQTDDVGLLGDDAYQACRDGIARDMATYFATINPLFDRARFLKACKVEA